MRSPRCRPGHGLESDYCRIEINVIIHSRTIGAELESDYCRIEIATCRASAHTNRPLESDYCRIEMSLGLTRVCDRH